MKSKALILILVVTFNFYACKKDKIDHNTIKISEIEETVYSPVSSIPARTIKYSFKYDDRARIAQINDRKFNYGSNNRVSSTRINRSSQNSDGTVQVYIETLRFQWDGNGNIKTIIADSIYHHRYSKSNNTVTTHMESLNRGIVIAEYQYEGKKVSSISYLTDFNVPSQAWNQEKISFTYDGNNINRSIKDAQLSTSVGTGLGGSLPLSIHTYHQYDRSPNYLYTAYLQLGFHPYNFGAVVSENNASSIYTELQAVGTPLSGNPDWSKAEKFSFEFNSQGFVTTITSSVSGTLPGRKFSIRYN